MNAHPRVVAVLKQGYCLNFKVKPPLTCFPLIKNKYVNWEKQEFLLNAVFQMVEKNAVLPVEKAILLWDTTVIFFLSPNQAKIGDQ